MSWGTTQTAILTTKGAYAVQLFAFTCRHKCRNFNGPNSCTFATTDDLSPLGRKTVQAQGHAKIKLDRMFDPLGPAQDSAT
jgi:hypothetical protein